MFGNEVSDYKKLKEIRKKLDENGNLKQKLMLKSVYYCGSKPVINNSGAAVGLIANNKTARFFGITTCKSPWCCPVCTARQMSKYAEKIGCAIDALKEQGLVAAMITFTVPHTSGFTCEQITEIAYNVWKMFVVHGNKIAKTYKNDIFANFMATFNSKHRVRVTEYTWGSAGWHPHFHTLFWFPKNRIQEILDWEEKLQKRWLELCKRYTIKELLKSYPKEQIKTARAKVETRVKIMYEKLNDVSKCVYISKDKQGKVIIQESSSYICGWGADKELTGNVDEKATKTNHWTWQQILSEAIATNNQKFWDLYFEYANATKKYRHTRVNFSVHSGICKIISDWKQTNIYKNALKKKHIQMEKEFGKWKMVCWFTLSQWQNIYSRDLEIKILELATQTDALQKITELLKLHQIPPPIINKAASDKIEIIWNNAA